jgi:rhamnose transport system substrate-binding protein
MFKKSVVTAALLVVALLLLVACGGAAAPTAAPATSAPAPTSAPPPTSAPVATSAPTTAPAATSASTTAAAATNAPSGTVIKAVPGKSVKMLMLPKFLGNAVFDQAHNGALEAAKELQNPVDLQYLAPASGAPGTAQIEIVTNATTQGVNAIMFDDNAGEQVTPAILAARAKGITVVTWDSQIPSGQGEQVFVAQVDFDQTGKVMADMALDILGPNGGKFAILSASPDASNQNAWIAAMKNVLATDPKYAKLQLLDVVYGNDQSEQSYNQALALVDKYPDMQLIMSPTTIGIAAAGKALTDNHLCDKVKVSGLGLPSENVAYVKNGCTPEFALWSFVDLGYLTYYTTYLVATGQMTPAPGVQFQAGRMGTYTITKDPTRPNTNALRVLMGPFSIYNKDNIDKAVTP